MMIIHTATPAVNYYFPYVLFFVPAKREGDLLILLNLQA